MRSEARSSRAGARFHGVGDVEPGPPGRGSADVAGDLELGLVSPAGAALRLPATRPTEAARRPRRTWPPEIAARASAVIGKYQRLVMIEWHTRLAFGVPRSPCDGFPEAPAEADGMGAEAVPAIGRGGWTGARAPSAAGGGDPVAHATGGDWGSAGQDAGGASRDGPLCVVRRTHHARGTWPDPEVVFGDVPASGVGAGAGRGRRPLRGRGRRAPDRGPDSARCI